MKQNNPVLRELLLIGIGEALCVALMLAVFALLDKFDRSVVLGGILGGVLAFGNFALTALTVLIASKKAVEQDVKGARSSVTSSTTLRYLLLVVLLVAGAKSSLFNGPAMMIPLLFVRPLLTVCELFRKKDDAV